MCPTDSTGCAQPADPIPVVECHRVTKRYGGQQVLSELSFSLHGGKVTCLVGPSGCGKTTVLKIVAGLVDGDPPSTVCWRNERRGRAGRLSEAISVVHQGAQLLPWRTALGNVMLPLEILRVPRNERKSQACRALRDVGLGDETHWDKYPHELSGGMRTRVRLAAALVVPSPVMLLDEPLTALDDWRKQELVLLFAGLFRTHDRAVLYITHDIEDGLFVSDEIIVFRNAPSGDFARIKVPTDWERTPELRKSASFRQLVETVREATRPGPKLPEETDGGGQLQPQV